MRFLSLFLPRLATDRIRRAPQARPSPEAPDTARPLATVAAVKGAYKIAALDAHAATLGLKIGTSLADARAMYPALVVQNADPAGDAETLLALVDWCRMFTPLAAPDEPDGAMLDISGAAHLFGGEDGLLDTITHRLRQQGFAVRASIAGSPGAAWALARFPQSLSAGGDACRSIPADMSETARARLFGPMPLAALRLDERAIMQLGQAGLRRIGDLLLRPRAPITARFGPDVFQRLDALLGRVRHPISPRFEAPAFVAERRFADGITQRDAIEATILALSYDLCGLLARHGEGARRLDVSLFRVDGVVKHITAGTSRPLRDPKAMARLFRERIESIGEEGLDTGYGFEVIRLAALAAERQDQEQSTWDNGGRDAADLADLIDRLGARFGLSRVTRLVPAETHIPERAAVSLAAGVHRQPAAKQALLRLDEASDPETSRQETSKPEISGQPAPESKHLPERPIRLLQRPEPIDTIASVPDGPPLRFRWRKVMHQVAAIEGPERIGPEWWKSPAEPRDYFRAEDTAGQRFWLFREGLYQNAPEPRWFMHGLFA